MTAVRRRALLGLRGALLLGAAALPTVLLARLGLAAVHPELAALRTGGVEALQTLPFPRALVALAVLALLACWLRLAGGALLYAAAVVRQPRLSPEPGARPWRSAGTPLVRRAVLAALGLAVPTAVLLPAHAATSAADRLAGLPLPDRTTGFPQPSRTVTVRPGDSLWSIASGLLPPHAGIRLVARECRALHAANAAVIGPDPDLIFPDTHLVVPRHDRPGKERP